MDAMAKQGLVLVVEDEPILNNDMTDALRDDGLEALQAYTAEEALALLEHHGGVRVVFTDVNLPGPLDGVALAGEVRRRWPQIDVLITSGRMAPDVASLDLVAHYGRFVPKPYPTAAVTRRIREIMDSGEGARAWSPAL